MNADKRDIRSDFTDVDRASDPGHLVRFLNTVSALEVVRNYKRRSFDVLGLQPGQVVLDLGCGNGDDVRELAQFVGPTGRVVGVDRSETLIATALERLALEVGFDLMHSVRSEHHQHEANGKEKGEPDEEAWETEVRAVRPPSRARAFSVIRTPRQIPE